MKKLMFQKELTLIKQVYYKNVCFVIIAILKIGFKFEPRVCNKCHNTLMGAYELKSIAIFNVKGVHFRSIFWDIIINEAVNRLNNSALDDKGVL